MKTSWGFMTTKERADVVRFYLIDKSWTYSQVAHYLGVTRSAIAGICNRNGIKTSPPKAKPLPSAPSPNERVIVPFPAPPVSREEAVDDIMRKAKLKAKRKNSVQSAVIMVLANKREDRQKGIEPKVERYTGPAWEPLPDLVPVHLMDLKTHDCRWPVTEKSGWFCGGQVEAGKVYCAAHASRAYTGAPQIIFKKKEKRFG